MDKKLYTEEEYARVKWFIVNAQKMGTQDDIFAVIRKGYLKNIQIRDSLHQEGVIDLEEIKEEFED